MLTKFDQKTEKFWPETWETKNPNFDNLDLTKPKVWPKFDLKPKYWSKNWKMLTWETKTQNFDKFDPTKSKFGQILPPQNQTFDKKIDFLLEKSKRYCPSHNFKFLRDRYCISLSLKGIYNVVWPSLRQYHTPHLLTFNFSIIKGRKQSIDQLI